MEKKINIAELLKDCPKGMELDCTMFDYVTFERFDVEQNRCYFKSGPADTFWTTCYGTFNGSPFGKCVIFPKGKTTWEDFVQPCKFKVGDIVKDKDGYKVRITEVSIEDGCYGYESLAINGIGGIPFCRQDDWELVPNKFDINTLKPFDKILVRLTNGGVWSATFFSHYDKEVKWGRYRFVTTSSKGYSMCIPYESNEHLLGTSNDCADYYKTWE